MKSTINYYYGLFPDVINSQNNFYYFWFNEEKYYFVPFNNDIKLVEEIYHKLISEHYKLNEIIYNKDGNLTTSLKEKEYALLKVNCIENEIVKLNDFFKIIIPTGNPINWGEVWANKIDYLEYQVSQRALGKDNILNSFSYYVGLAENAIEYYNLLEHNGSDVIVGVQHKRVYSKNYEINYYNPINMIIDYNVRDIAEYIKFAFFEKTLDKDNFYKFLDNLNLNNIMMNLLFVRLLFPTYYFDSYEKLLNDEVGETDLVNIIKLSNDYELFLKDFYFKYADVYNLKKIDWIVR